MGIYSFLGPPCSDLQYSRAQGNTQTHYSYCVWTSTVRNKENQRKLCNFFLCQQSWKIAWKMRLRYNQQMKNNNLFKSPFYTIFKSIWGTASVTYRWKRNSKKAILCISVYQVMIYNNPKLGLVNSTTGNAEHIIPFFPPTRPSQHIWIY